MIKHGLLIGRTDGMEQAVMCLFNRCEQAKYFRHLSELSTQTDSVPELILVLQQFSDEYHEEQIEGLLTEYPLSRVICCYGPWCVSDGRNRNFWPSAVRVPIAEIQQRVEREMEVIAGIRPPLERTAGRDEIFAFEHGSESH